MQKIGPMKDKNNLASKALLRKRQKQLYTPDISDNRILEASMIQMTEETLHNQNTGTSDCTGSNQQECCVFK